jgi:hypothetical protein
MRLLSKKLFVASIMAVWLTATVSGCGQSEQKKTASRSGISDSAEISETKHKEVACIAIEKFLDSCVSLGDKSSRSVHMTRREEIAEFHALKMEFETSDVFIKLPEHLRDYIISHNDVWEDCRLNDNLDACGQARGMQQSIPLMCNQWVRE